MNKYTPEPWYLVEAPHELRIHPDFQGKAAGCALTIGSRALVFLAPRTGSHRGEKMVYGPFSETDITNAHLIAAAPDLLEACRVAAHEMYGHGWYCEKLVLAAIARAEGRQS